MLVVLAILACLSGCLNSERGTSVWDRADRKTTRLEPDRFPELPPAVASELTRRGCTIPQTFVQQKPHNVISGRFRNRAQLDWAVLCSVNRVSTILVFWAGSARDVVELAKRPDAGDLQATEEKVDENSIRYSRYIATAQEETILQSRSVYEAPGYPPITHEGIEDGFAEKGSDVQYWHDGRWHEFPGAD